MPSPFLSGSANWYRLLEEVMVDVLTVDEDQMIIEMPDIEPDRARDFMLCVLEGERIYGG